MRSLAICVIAVAASAAPGAVVQIPASRDNTLYEDAAGATSNGAGPAMFSGLNSQARKRRAVVHFDIAAMIPQGSVITSATLVLTENGANASPATVSPHRARESWGEGTSTGTGGGGNGGPASAGDATWLHRFHNTTYWSTVGGVFDPAPSASLTIAGNAVFSWTSPTLAADVQDMLDNPAWNFGWFILGDEAAAGSAKRFATREDPNPSARPMLVLDYAVPGPASIMLAGAAATLRRRRTHRR